MASKVECAPLSVRHQPPWPSTAMKVKGNLVMFEHSEGLSKKLTRGVVKIFMHTSPTLYTLLAHLTPPPATQKMYTTDKEHGERMSAWVECRKPFLDLVSLCVQLE